VAGEAVVVVDWGTSSFRLWVLDQAGAVLSRAVTREGMSTLDRAQFAPVLERHLGEAKVAPDTPVVVCGMAGAAQGWCEAPYADLPAALGDITAGAVAPPDTQRPVMILPGLAQRIPGRADVMRGEETILLGAWLGEGASGTICLPGTHSKWARLDGGAVTGFETAMTGELFALLSQKSTLSHFASAPPGDLTASPAFAAAVEEALAAPQSILRALFSVRATPLVEGRDRAADMPARLSGLLIGLEIAGNGAERHEEVTLIASGSIGDAYARALALAGHPVTRLDAEIMVLNGLTHAAATLFPDAGLNYGTPT